VQSIISAPVHYLALGSWDTAEAQRVRKLAWALGLNVHYAPELAGEAAGLKIQPCREELCQMPVEGFDKLMDLLQINDQAGGSGN